MKILTGLLVATMLLGLVAGCQQTTEVTYRQVSVGIMTVSIPSEWERASEEAEGIAEDFGEETTVDAYNNKSEEAILVLCLWDMVQYLESEGLSWVSWEALEVEGMTKEDFVALLGAGFIGGVEQLTREKHHQLTIDDKEAWEQQFSGRVGGEPMKFTILCVFGDDDVGLLTMFVEEPKWGEFEEIWGKIRDSVKF